MTWWQAYGAAYGGLTAVMFLLMAFIGVVSGEWDSAPIELTGDGPWIRRYKRLPGWFRAVVFAAIAAPFWPVIALVGVWRMTGE